MRKRRRDCLFLKEAGNRLVLRTVYLSPALDDKLRLLAFKLRKSKNEIIREILAAKLCGCVACEKRLVRMKKLAKTA